MRGLRWRRRRRPQKYAFSITFASQSGLKTAVFAGGMVAVIYTEKTTTKKSRKIHATCGDRVAPFVLLVFAQVHYNRCCIRLSLETWYRSVSWVRTPPNACSYKFVGTFSREQIGLRKARERELATLDERSTSSGIYEACVR